MKPRWQHSTIIAMCIFGAPIAALLAYISQGTLPIPMSSCTPPQRRHDRIGPYVRIPFKFRLLIAMPLALISLTLAGCDAETKDKARVPAANQTQGAVTDPIAEGRKQFRACAVCHTTKKDGRNGVGPNLWGIYGAKAGARDGFAYSRAMHTADIIWNDDTLDVYLTKPAAFIPNNRMAFPGVQDEQKRAYLIAYLKTLSGE